MAERNGQTSAGETPAALDAIVGTSDWAAQVRAVIARVACCQSNVMVTGPSGTGKELIAQAIHSLSPRAQERFIPVDCASITGTLFASHMFGHVKGAFTGATHSTVGCFRAADRGTIFLDEIGELELEIQAKLLRVLQQRVVVPVGSEQGTPVNVRVIAATNRDLHREVAAGRFREDLFYRLNVVAIQTLPLRQRPADIEEIANHFLAQFAAIDRRPLKRLSPAALAHLQRYPWPGNVRELENAMERAVVFCDGDVIEPRDLPLIELPPGREVPLVLNLPEDRQRIECGEPSASETAPAVLHFPEEGRWPTAAEVEREFIRRTLERVNFNQSAAARLLDMNRFRLRRRIATHQLEPLRPAAEEENPSTRRRAA